MGIYPCKWDLLQVSYYSQQRLYKPKHNESLLEQWYIDDKRSKDNSAYLALIWIWTITSTETLWMTTVLLISEASPAIAFWTGNMRNHLTAAKNCFYDN